MRRNFVPILACLLVAAGGCRRSTGTVPPTGTPVIVNVTNHFGMAVEVYAIGAGTIQRLGLVNAGMEGRFTVPPAMIGGGVVELEARATPSQTVRSEPLHLAPGDIVDFMITNALFNSTAVVRP